MTNPCDKCKIDFKDSEYPCVNGVCPDGNIEMCCFVISIDNYEVSGYYLKEGTDALFRVKRDGVMIREGFIAAYKIFNICAHAQDIIDGEKAKSVSGYEIALSPI